MRRSTGTTLAFVGTTILLASCASTPHRSPRAGAPETRAPGGTVEVGLASWYGEPYHGRPTASGHRYDMWEMTAAHRTLPFGTKVRVTNTDTGASAIVTINDRGPFVAGRILDLSRAAAEALGAVGPGVIPVRIEVLEQGDGMPNAPCWEVQVGAFAEASNVRRATERLARAGLTTRTLPAGGGLTRVRVTATGGRTGAQELAQRLQADWPGALAVPCGAWQ